MSGQEVEKLSGQRGIEFGAIFFHVVHRGGYLAAILTRGRRCHITRRQGAIVEIIGHYGENCLLAARLDENRCRPSAL